MSVGLGPPQIAAWGRERGGGTSPSLEGTFAVKGKVGEEGGEAEWDSPLSEMSGLFCPLWSSSAT